ncbi:unnamed protein product [Vitrella brassicaformis CCMP3155]|uniref:Sorting nexin/Vps5-like C-terminal domain-containing protein n=1 Tax=Vitrella brassicaformis (strain CCMP3155) TaxID=1169540 RepID=A0A0G4EGG8_VITBC|nr:unnamed protein product [Vitrella brassicaformis CCMP3155]|eukprot:CEL95237.1 unnamed protein product [Vitrella brassicaformis CCMP3155]
MEKLKEGFRDVMGIKPKRVEGDDIERERAELEEYDKFAAAFERFIGKFGAMMNGMEELYGDLSHVLEHFYTDDCPYRGAAVHVSDILQVFTRQKDRMRPDLEALKTANDELLVKIREVERKMVERDRAWNTKVHYDKKLDNLKCNRDRVRAAGRAESAKQMEKLARNEKKMGNSSHEFSRMDDVCRSELEGVLSTKFSDTKPVITKMLGTTMGLFVELGEYLRKLEGPMQQIKDTTFNRELNLSRRGVPSRRTSLPLPSAPGNSYPFHSSSSSITDLKNNLYSSSPASSPKPPLPSANSWSSSPQEHARQQHQYHHQQHQQHQQQQQQQQEDFFNGSAGNPFPEMMSFGGAGGGGGGEDVFANPFQGGSAYQPQPEPQPNSQFSLQNGYGGYGYASPTSPQQQNQHQTYAPPTAVQHHAQSAYGDHSSYPNLTQTQTSASLAYGNTSPSHHQHSYQHQQQQQQQQYGATTYPSSYPNLSSYQQQQQQQPPAYHSPSPQLEPSPIPEPNDAYGTETRPGWDPANTRQQHQSVASDLSQLAKHTQGIQSQLGSVMGMAGGMGGLGGGQQQQGQQSSSYPALSTPTTRQLGYSGPPPMQQVNTAFQAANTLNSINNQMQALGMGAGTQQQQQQQQMYGQPSSSTQQGQGGGFPSFA